MCRVFELLESADIQLNFPLEYRELELSSKAYRYDRADSLMAMGQMEETMSNIFAQKTATDARLLNVPVNHYLASPQGYLLMVC